MAVESTSTCEQCGATVYREHIDAGIARYEAGKMMCPHCVEEYESAHDSAGTGAGEVFEPIAIEGGASGESSAASETQITTFGAGRSFGATAWDDSQFMRPLDPKNPGASRCRTFHSKLNDGAISFLNQQVNDWLEANPQIVIKFSNSVIGTFEAKHPEPHLIVTMFY